MKIAISLLCLAFLFVFSAVAQDAPFSPQYLVGTGITYDYYGATGFAANHVFAVKLSGSLPIYSWTAIANTKTTASISTGAAYTFLQKGDISAVALGTAGLVTGEATPILGQFTAGGLLLYDLGHRLKPTSTTHYYLVGGVSLLNITSRTVQPVYGAGLAIGF